MKQVINFQRRKKLEQITELNVQVFRLRKVSAEFGV